MCGIEMLLTLGIKMMQLILFLYKNNIVVFKLICVFVRQGSYFPG